MRPYTKSCTVRAMLVMVMLLSFTRSSIRAFPQVGSTNAAPPPPRVPAPVVTGKDTKFSIIVMLEAEPGTETAKEQQQALLATAAQANITIKTRQTFDSLLNGISLEVPSNQRYALEKILDSLPYFSRFEEITATEMSEVPSDPASSTDGSVSPPALPATNIGDQFKGQGVKIGIIDSGVDYQHIAFNNCFAVGCTISTGYDFVGDAFDGHNDPVPRDLPLEMCNGHGTYVAGIIAANDKYVMGVAPQATIGAYRVFGCKGITVNDIIIKAMERAMQDKMDVVNLSLVVEAFYTDGITAMATQSLVAHGIVVVAAAGNEGQSGIFSLSSPSIAPGVIAVASVRSANTGSFSFILHASDTPIRYISSTGYALSAERRVPCARMVEPAARKECRPLLDDYTNCLVIMERGSCNYTAMAKLAADAHASGVLVLNNNQEYRQPSVDSGADTPVLLVLDEDTEHLRKETANGIAALHWEERMQKSQATGAWVYSAFSSSGPTSDFVNIKPDLSASGELVRSTTPVGLGSYAMKSGTSVATPYVAGLAALAIQRLRQEGVTDNLPDAVRRMLVQTTDAIPSAPHSTLLMPVSFTGVGVARHSFLSEPNWGISPSSVAFLGDASGAKEAIRSVEVSLVGQVPPGTVSFRLRSAPAVEMLTGGHNSGMAATLAQLVTIQATPETMSIAGGNNQDTVKITLQVAAAPSELASTWLLTGLIEAEHVAAGSAVKTVRSIPYQTTIGPLSTLNPLKEPRLVSQPESNILAVSLSRRTVVKLSFDLALPCNHVFGVIEDVRTKRRLGIASSLEWRRLLHMRQGGRIEAYWDGTVLPVDESSKGSPTVETKTRAPTPDGTYRILLFALRPYANPSLDESYEVWHSPTFEVDGVLADAERRLSTQNTGGPPPATSESTLSTRDAPSTTDIPAASEDIESTAEQRDPSLATDDNESFKLGDR